MWNDQDWLNFKLFCINHLKSNICKITLLDGTILLSTLKDKDFVTDKERTILLFDEFSKQNINVQLSQISKFHVLDL